MGFDEQTEDKPLVDGTKRTTKVNFGVVIGVVVFFIVAISVVVAIARSPGETRQDMHEQHVDP